MTRSAARLKQELTIDNVKALQSRVTDLEDRLLNARANKLLASVGAEAAEAEAAQSRAESEVRVYEELLREQKQSLEMAINDIQNRKSFSVEQILMQQQLEVLKSESQLVRQEIGQLKISLSSPSRIMLLQNAVKGNSKPHLQCVF